MPTTTYPSPITLIAWPETDDAVCFDARDPYVAYCWTWTIGPSCAAALHLIAEMLDGARCVTIGLDELAKTLGISYNGGTHSVLCRTLDRLERFGMAMALPDGTLAVRTQVRPLTQRQLRRAPALVAALHHRLATNPAREVPA